MFKPLVSAVALFAQCTALAVAGDGTAERATQPPITAQYEFVPGTPIGMLRLDRYSGRLARAIRDVNQIKFYWEEIEVPDLPATPSPEPRFQLMFVPGEKTSLMLVDTTTGKAWGWEPEYPWVTSNGRYVWRPYAEEVRPPNYYGQFTGVVR